jgi:hypothetical protein
MDEGYNTMRATTPNICHRHDRLYSISTISITISTPPYFVIIDFIIIGDIVRLLLFIYYKIFNTMVMIVDPIMCE